MEIWRDIDGFDGLYQVSNLGRVRRLHKTIPPRILTTCFDNRGYPKVGLCHGGKCKTRKIHRLVALAFIPNPDGKPEVNHIDGNPHNSCASNLEWVTHLENSRHAVATGLIKSGKYSPLAKLTNEQVRYIRDNPDGLLQRELAAKFDVTQQTISDVQHGKYYQDAGGRIRDKRGVPDDIRDEIKRLYVFGSQEFGTRALAKKFGIARSMVWRIVREN